MANLPGTALRAFDAVALAVANVYFHTRHRRQIGRYRRDFGSIPNVARPRSYGERMLWRRLIDHNPLFVTFADKLASKAYSQRLCPDLAMPETLWVGDDADVIPADVLSRDVMVKANHGCGFNLAVTGGVVDRGMLKARSDGWLRRRYGRRQAEWAYSQVPPRLFVEELIVPADGILWEIEIRASNGRFVAGSIVRNNKQPGTWRAYLDRAGRTTPGFDCDNDFVPGPLPPGVPVAACYAEAIGFAERLSVGVDYARFDFFWDGRKLYGGEITLYPGACRVPVGNPDMDQVLQRGWDLSAAGFVREDRRGWAGIYQRALRRSLRRSAPRPDAATP